MGHGIGVPDFHGAIRRDGAEESADDSLSLVRPPDIAITDVEEDDGVDPSGESRRRGQERQHCLLARRHQPGTVNRRVSRVSTSASRAIDLYILCTRPLMGQKWDVLGL